jgi:hypothetical protein
MPNTASSWKNMMAKQRVNAMLSGNANRLRQIHAALAANAAKVASPAVVEVAPLVSASAPARQGINLSDFSPNNLAMLGQVAQVMKTGKASELEGSYAALNAAEKLGKKKKPANSSRRATGRRRITRKTTCRTRRGKRT